MKVNKTILVLCLLSIVFTLPSCRPKGILHSWEMRKVLIDLHKADALLQIHGLSQASPEDKALYYAKENGRNCVSKNCGDGKFELLR